MEAGQGSWGSPLGTPFRPPAASGPLLAGQGLRPPAPRRVGTAMTGTPLTAEGHPGPQAGQGLECDLVLLVPGPPTPCRQMPPNTETGPTRGGHPASRSSAPPPQRSSSPSDGRPRRAPGGPPHSPSPGPQAWHPPGPAPRVASLAPRVSAHIHSGPGPPEPRAYDGPFPPTSLPSLPAAPPSAGPSPGSPHFPCASQDVPPQVGDTEVPVRRTPLLAGRGPMGVQHWPDSFIPHPRAPPRGARGKGAADKGHHASSWMPRRGDRHWGSPAVARGDLEQRLGPGTTAPARLPSQPAPGRWPSPVPRAPGLHVAGPLHRTG